MLHVDVTFIKSRFHLSGVKMRDTCSEFMCRCFVRVSTRVKKRRRARGLGRRDNAMRQRKLVAIAIHLNGN